LRCTPQHPATLHRALCSSSRTSTANSSSSSQGRRQTTASR
jgi:hypothetical protein